MSRGASASVIPTIPTQVAAVLGVRDLAVATSGGYERGEHLVDPRTGGNVSGELRSMTVMGPSMTLADGYATAAFVMGRAGVAWVAGFAGYGALAITADGRQLSSDVAHALLVRDAIAVPAVSLALRRRPTDGAGERQPLVVVPLDPGARTGTPAAQAGQVAGPGSQVGTSSVHSASAG